MQILFSPLEQTTRGTGGDIIILDEAAHIKEDLFYEVVLPILALEKTAFLAISTADSSSNYYSKLMETRDTEGNLFFRIIRAGRICEACQPLPYAQKIQCDHTRSTEHWKSDHKVKRLKCLYKGKEARALLELGGVVANDFQPAFDSLAIKRLFEAQTKYVCHVEPSAIIMCVDPNGGGPSEMAICSAYFVGAMAVVSFFLFTREHTSLHNVGNVVVDNVAHIVLCGGFVG